MIKDVLIIKDGLPLISKSFSNAGNFISNSNDVLLMSGFLSALSSFSKEFKDLGSINEFKMSESELRLAFLKHPSIPNLIFLASFDKTTSSVNVHRFLRQMSYSFLKQFDISCIENWDGNTKAFSSFIRIIKRHANNIINEKDVDFKEKVVELFDRIQQKIDNVAIHEEKEKIEKKMMKERREDSLSPFQHYIPISKISDSVNPDFYLTGSNSKRVLKKIDGKKSVQEIGRDLNLSPKIVHNICKNLIKLGFIELSEK